jgi:hypothetical protein
VTALRNATVCKIGWASNQQIPGALWKAFPLVFLSGCRTWLFQMTSLFVKYAQKVGSDTVPTRKGGRGGTPYDNPINQVETIMHFLERLAFLTAFIIASNYPDCFKKSQDWAFFK